MSHNFADLFEHSVDAMPERTALIEGDIALTFAEIDARANRLADHLISIGVGPGVHVGFQMHNGIATMVTLIACFKARAVPININYRYGVDELRYLYDNADLEVLVYHATYTAAVLAAAAQAPGLRHLIVVDDTTAPDALVTPNVAATVIATNAGIHRPPADPVPYAKALANGDPTRRSIDRTPDDLFMMYTGGTTGRPKGVMWRQEDMWRVLGGGIDFYTGEPVSDEYQQSRVGAQGESSTWFVLPPLIHAAAMMPTFAALLSGNAVIFEPKFDARRVWRVVEQRRPQIMVITGDAMARPLIDEYRTAPVDAASLVAIASGAALLSQPVKNALLELFPWAVVSDSIGSSETGFGGIGFAQKDDNPGRGPRVQSGRGAIVVDDAGCPVEPGSEGWLAKTGAVPIGYYKDPAKTERLFKTVDGTRIVVTDDRAKVEADGSVTLIGRGNMVVNTGGEKVFVEEVESVVKAHDAIYDAVVIGVPHERWGQQVAAVVSVAGGEPVDFAALETHVRRHLAGYKVPRKIWLAEVVTRAPSGKPDYRWATEFAAGHAPDHQAD
ncbi:acyl-CoA synthetase [Nocardia sp. NBC_00565]|uniref:acyl-CoA synthetase n=1 Tax=Nocardia sp. NBC_00565 TaxID=2975993 RepID=UPI002E80D517|nr:acyl-CoA synthetase [Nocardia sp. NBC_00565]WUC00627.1 acyl-CoA synthetase [Nocardia sp. NBC_00565]